MAYREVLGVIITNDASSTFPDITYLYSLPNNKARIDSAQIFRPSTVTDKKSEKAAV
jgi:hypothetical protein